TKRCRAELERDRFPRLILKAASRTGCTLLRGSGVRQTLWRESDEIPREHPRGGHGRGDYW
ncbi:MAG: hypothetical protein AAFU66_03750, partial [Pseudomonadota bacterium]